MKPVTEKNSNLLEKSDYVGRRKLNNRWKRSAGLAHGRTQSRLFREAAEGQKLFNQVKFFLEIYVFKWAWHYIKSRFGVKWPFQYYSNSPNDNGIYDFDSQDSAHIDNNTVISLIGDWGSGTKDAYEIADLVNQDRPDFTIHLGDIYYVGTKKEVNENMLGERVKWPEGTKGSFALNANHEMYAKGKAFFKYFLPTLGIVDPKTRQMAGQKASYFCLRDEYWSIVALDTGYYSVGWPIFEMIFKPSAKLHDEQLNWLKNTLKLQEDNQHGIIFLSHHQYYSEFERGYSAPANQLSQFINRPVLWFWGHEHRLAIYGKHTKEKGKLSAFGRCIGHGGLPIEDISDKPKSGEDYNVGLVLYDKRIKEKIGGSNIPVGYNGYANLIFTGKNLTVEYKDIKQCLIREKWEVQDGGIIKGLSIEKLIDDPELALYNNARLSNAIR